MWEVEICFDDHETVICRGEEEEIPIWTALKYYNLFVKIAGGHALYWQDHKNKNKEVGLEDKILGLSKDND